MENKYNKMFRYKEHYDLKRLFDENSYVRYFTDILIMLILLFIFSYPDWLKATDVVLSLFYIVFLKVMEPMMYRGDMPAYYRREYDYKDVGLYIFLKKYSVYSLIRFIFVAVVDYMNRVEGIPQDSIFKGMYQRFTTPITLILVLYAISNVYFRNRYISIKDYSNGILFRMKELQMGEREAVVDLTKRRDEELGISEYNGYAYDLDKKNKKGKSEKSDKFGTEEMDKEENENIRRQGRTKNK